MSKLRRREHGEGGIDQRGPNTFRLRYRVDGKRFSVTFKGRAKRPKLSFASCCDPATPVSTLRRTG